MPFADCSGNFAPVTPAQLCEGFNKCGDMQLNSANMNGVIRWLESLAGAAGDPGAVAAALAGDNAAREALAAALAADPEALASFYNALAADNVGRETLATALAGDPEAMATILTAIITDNAAREAIAGALAADPEAMAAIAAALPYATVADLLTPSTSTDKIVTDDVLRAALGTGQDRLISIKRNGTGVHAENSDASVSAAVEGIFTGTGDGHAVYGEVNGSGNGNAVAGVINGTGLGNGVLGIKAGSGDGSALVGVKTGPGYGHGVYAEVSGTGDGQSGQFIRLGTGDGGAVLGRKESSGSGHAVGGVTYDGIGSAGSFFADGTSNGPSVHTVHNSTTDGAALRAEKFSNSNGQAILAYVRNTVLSNSPVIHAIGEGGGDAATIYAEHNNAGNGPAIYGSVGYTAFGGGAATGIGSAIYMVNGPNGARDAVAKFDLSGPNTTWGISTNGAIFTAGGVTTSDKRLKRDIVQIDGTRAAEFAAKVRFYTFDKLTDPASIIRMQDDARARAKSSLADLERQLVIAIDAEERAAANAKKQAQAEKSDGASFDQHMEPSPTRSPDDIRRDIDACKAQCEITFDVSDKALSIGRQAGVIAQELQELTKDFSEFAFLVKLSNPNDQESVLVVDYTSLDAVMMAAIQHKLFSV